jgi:hypothetical protein
MIVPSYDEVFLQDEENVPDLTRFLGIPIAVRRIPVDSYLEVDCTNVEVASLYRNCNLSATETISGSGPDSAIQSAPTGGSTASSDDTISGTVGLGAPSPRLGHYQRDDHTSVSGTAAGSSSLTRGPSSRGTSSRGGSSRGGLGRPAGGPSSIISRFEQQPFPLPPYATTPELPMFPGFGGIPKAWEPLLIGPVLLVRLDQKPLHPLHAAAILAFTTYVLRKSFSELIDAEQRRAWQHQLVMAGTGVTSASESAASWVGEADVFQRRRDVLTLASQARFTEFFEAYKARRVEGHPELLLQIEEDEQNQRDARIRKVKVEIPDFKMEELEARTEWADVPNPFDV